MKRNVILTLASIFFWITASGIVLAGGGPKTCDPDWNRTCRDITDGSCVVFNDADGIPRYTIAAWVGCGDEAPVLGVNWPHTDDAGNVVFTYIEGPYDGEGTYGTGVSYNAWNIPGNIIGSNPGGAALDIKNLPAECADPPNVPGDILYKQNVTVNKGKDAIIELIYPPGTGAVADCNSKYLIFGSNCGGGPGQPLWGPGSSLPIPAESTSECSGKPVTVTYDRCTGAITEVLCDGVAASASTAYIELTRSGHITTEPLKNIGPPPSVVMCLDGGAYAAVLRDDVAYFCKE